MDVHSLNFNKLQKPERKKNSTLRISFFVNKVVQCELGNQNMQSNFTKLRYFVKITLRLSSSPVFSNSRHLQGKDWRP